MAEPLTPKEVVSIEELAISNMYEKEATLSVTSSLSSNCRTDTIRALDQKKARHDS
jgi:hypothetical protein